MLPWLLILALSQVWIVVFLLPGCGKKKKEETAKPPPKYKMTDGTPTSPANKTDPKDGKSADDKKGPADAKGNSSEEKKGAPDPKKDGAAKPNASGDKPPGAPADKGPAKDAIIPALNKDHLVPQVKDAQQTVRPGGGDKDKVVSNPIVSAVTEQFPTVAEPLKQQELQIDKTQGSEHTDKTQKD